MIKRILISTNFILLIVFSSCGQEKKNSKSDSQLKELTELQNNSFNTFNSKGLERSLGLEFSIAYPKSYSLTNVKDKSVVKGFVSHEENIIYMVSLNKADHNFTSEEIINILSKENIEYTIRNVSTGCKIQNFTDDFSIDGKPSCYIDYTNNLGNDLSGLYRQYFLMYNNYFITINCAVINTGNDITKNAIEKFNNYKVFFNSIVNSFKILEKGKNNLSVNGYLNFKNSVKSIDKSIENDEWTDELYRNKKYNFRVQFPKHWEYDRGTAKYTIARSINRLAAASIPVTIIDYGNNSESKSDIFKAIPEEEFELQFMNEIFALENTKAENIELEKGYLDNFPAYIISFTTRISAGNKSEIFYNKQVQCLKNNILYNLSIVIPKDEWTNSMAITFNRVIESFKFEDNY